MHWALPVAIATGLAALGAAATTMYSHSTAECQAPAVVPYPAGAALDGRLLVEYHHEGNEASFALCVEDESGQIRYREQFSLTGAQTRTFDLRVVAGHVAVFEEVAGTGLGGAAASVHAFDLSLCDQRTYEWTQRTQARLSGLGMETETGRFECNDSSASGEVSASSGDRMGLGDDSVPAPSDRQAGGTPPGTAALAATGGGLIFGALLWRFVPGVRVLGFLLFTRLRQPEILQLQTRNQIYEAIRQEPGIHAKAIADRLELGGGQVEYHLQVLRRSGLVTRVPLGGQRSYFLRGQFSPSTMQRMAALHRGRGPEVVALLRRQPRASLGDVARQLQIGAAQASKLVTRLCEHGVVQAQREGRFLRLSLCPGL